MKLRTDLSDLGIALRYYWRRKWIVEMFVVMKGGEKRIVWKRGAFALGAPVRQVGKWGTGANGGDCSQLSTAWAVGRLVAIHNKKRWAWHWADHNLTVYNKWLKFIRRRLQH